MRERKKDRKKEMKIKIQFLGKMRMEENELVLLYRFAVGFFV